MANKKKLKAVWRLPYRFYYAKPALLFCRAGFIYKAQFYCLLTIC